MRIGPIARVALMCAAAYGTHLLWIGWPWNLFPPLGIQALWPFEELLHLRLGSGFSQNRAAPVSLLAIDPTKSGRVIRELLILTPIVVVVWLVRVKALAGLASELAAATIRRSSGQDDTSDRRGRRAARS